MREVVERRLGKLLGQARDIAGLQDVWACTDVATEVEALDLAVPVAGDHVVAQGAAGLGPGGAQLCQAVAGRLCLVATRWCGLRVRSERGKRFTRRLAND